MLYLTTTLYICYIVILYLLYVLTCNEYIFIIFHTYIYSSSILYHVIIMLIDALYYSYITLVSLSKHPYSYAHTSLFVYIIIYLRCITCLPSVFIHSMYWYCMLYTLIYIVIILIYHSYNIPRYTLIISLINSFINLTKGNFNSTNLISHLTCLFYVYIQSNICLIYI